MKKDSKPSTRGTSIIVETGPPTSGIQPAATQKSVSNHSFQDSSDVRHAQNNRSDTATRHQHSKSPSASTSKSSSTIASGLGSGSGSRSTTESGSGSSSSSLCSDSNCLHSRTCSDESSQYTSSSVKSAYDDDDDVVRVENDDDEALLCGCGSITPKWLQAFHTAKWLLTMLGICAFVQSFVVNSIFPVGLSTLEKRFHMTRPVLFGSLNIVNFSTQTGIISSWYDFAVLIAVFPVCHWGNNGHKGKWIGYGTFLMGLGSFVCALPHYLIDPYKVGVDTGNHSDYGQCLSRDSATAKCESAGVVDDFDSSYLNPYFLIFLLGQTLHGVGATPLFSIGTTYLDENVSQKASPVYLAIHSVVTSIGPVIGLFVGGFLLTIYTDFDRVDMKTVSDLSGRLAKFIADFRPMQFRGPADPRWIGAWWLGFLGCSVAALLTAFPILMFARELPEAKRHRRKDVNQVHAVSQVDENDEILKNSNVKTLPKAIWNIMRNPTFVTCIVLGIFESIVINGFAAFMPKILETILSTTPTNASYLSSVVIFAAAAGVMIGGVAIRQLNLQVGGMLKMILACHVIALVLFVSFLIQCPAREFVGITVEYNKERLNRLFAANVTSGPSLLSVIGEHSTSSGSSSTSSSSSSSSSTSSSPLSTANPLMDQCNANCDCKSLWNPVCDTATQQTYYSACYAGCTKRHTVGFTDYWEDCKCVTNQSRAPTAAAAAGSAEVVSGFCTKECGLSMWIFLVLLFFSVVASFASGIPSQQIMLRVIPFQQRTLGIGVHWTFLRLLGFIPGGILFGLMIDTTCLKWQESACGKKQSCLVHDPYKLSWTILAVAVVCKLVSILATIIGYLTYRPNDLDNAASVMTTDSSRGPLSLTVNDDRNVAAGGGGKWGAYSKNNSVDADGLTVAEARKRSGLYVPASSMMANGKSVEF